MKGLIGALLGADLVLLGFAADASLESKLVANMLRTSDASLLLVAESTKRVDTDMIKHVMVEETRPVEISAFGGLGPAHGVACDVVDEIRRRYSPERTRARLVVSRLESANDSVAFASAMAATMSDCPYELRLGLYQPENIVMALGPDSADSGEVDQALFGDRHVQDHQRALSARKIDRGSKLLLSRYLFTDGTHGPYRALSRVDLADAESMLPPELQLDDFTFTQFGNGYVHYFIVDQMTNERNETYYTNFRWPVNLTSTAWHAMMAGCMP